MKARKKVTRGSSKHCLSEMKTCFDGDRKVSGVSKKFTVEHKIHLPKNCTSSYTSWETLVS